MAKATKSTAKAPARQTRISAKQLQEFIDKVAVKTRMRSHDIYVSRIDGSYFDHVDNPERLKWCLKYGVTEELQSAHGKDATVSIGYMPKERKWAGWSHRAATSFGIGYKVKSSDDLISGRKFPIGTVLKTMADCKKAAIAFADAVS